MCLCVCLCLRVGVSICVVCGHTCLSLFANDLNGNQLIFVRACDFVNLYGLVVNAFDFLGVGGCGP